MTSLSTSMRNYLKRKARFYQAGLTTQGRPRRRRLSLTEAERRAYNLAKYHRRAERRHAAGLTTRGTPRKASWFTLPANPFEHAWRDLAATFHIPQGNDYLTPSERCDL